MINEDYQYFLEVNKLQEKTLKVESQMNDLWNDMKKIESQRLMLGRKKGILETKVRNMVIEHNKIDYIKVKNIKKKNDLL